MESKKSTLFPREYTFYCFSFLVEFYFVSLRRRRQSRRPLKPFSVSLLGMQIGIGGEEVLKPNRENKRRNEPIKVYEVQRLIERVREGLFGFKHPRQKQIIPFS